ncbi:hypothetical protein [Microbacterium arborescens]|uniref:hypothetical protein n=1 Tax=Microbacterium arborescens TaxID=33883 RepID=UPI000DF80DD5|nr:hypothetical protein [Microbacterium arborescens]
MAAPVTVYLIPTHARLDDDCPVCGWADLWRVALHRLSPSGVTTVHEATHCTRCHDRDRT